jgi:acyl-coenzyme A synthetase/AMP-(fatty) acid ligase
MWDEVFKEIIKKIELQSVLVLLITLLFGCILLYKDNSLNTPAGILGSISIGFGVLYTFGSFFANQIKESYKDVISEYKAHITTLKSGQKFLEDHYQKTISNKEGREQVGDYSIGDELGDETEKG